MRMRDTTAKPEGAVVLLVDPTSVNDFETRIRILEANFGRYFGWYVERDGQRLAVLTKPAYAEMFWVSYQIEPVSRAPEIIDALFEDNYWSSPKYTIRSREFPQFVVEAFGPVRRDDECAIMRALYIVPTFTWWERLRYSWRLYRVYRKL